ncbi:unnamed protein product [Didymodactylos carnosus]|uniref:Uncharacterized protein n=1 Tax=Didymodactylos carnosus TaxID=1234261 RepID=A0A8S2E6X2_9BILA|nr:unnamed protein product [Didymodactylos carnosus]CAF3830832.1 unnamed protein product [Didymodactylos carnosus]
MSSKRFYNYDVDSGYSTRAIIVIVIGVLLGISVLISFIVLILCLRKRNQRRLTYPGFVLQQHPNLNGGYYINSPPISVINPHYPSPQSQPPPYTTSLSSPDTKYPTSLPAP